MTDDATNLDRLHDLALPPEVPWWPLAPGWYVLIFLTLVLLLTLARRLWKNWHAKAYRRAALRELSQAADTTAIAGILRRTALAIAPREEIAARTGSGWLDWLADRCPEPMPDIVREQLTRGVYAAPVSVDPALRDYASRWIHRHR